MSNRQIQLQSGPGLWPPTWPMGLTMLRLLLLPVFLWLILLDSNRADHRFHWLAVGVFAVMALTDKLDGYLARRLNQTSKLGAVLDPVADKLLVACSIMLLSFDWIAPPGFRIPWGVVAAIYGKDVITAIGVVALLSLTGKVTIMPRPLGKASTVLQLSMVVAVLVAPTRDPRWIAAWKTVVLALWWTVSIVAALACGDYLVFGARQYAHFRRVRARTPVPGEA